MIDIKHINVGDKVHYVPGHYGKDKYENGIVKEIPPFAYDPNSHVGYNCARVVYNCGGNWENYKDYTSALTNLNDLHHGWRFE